MPENPPARSDRRRSAGLALAVSSLLVLASAPPAAAAEGGYETLTITAEPSTVAVGDVVTVTARATGVVDASAYQLAFSYDDDLLAPVEDGGVLPAGGFGTVTGTAAGTGAGPTVSAVSTRLGTSPGLTGDQTLVTFRFTARSAGTADIALSSGSLIDAAGAASPVDTGAAGLVSRVTVTGRTDPGPGTDPGTDPGAGPGTGTGGGGTGAGGSAGAASGSGLAGTGADAAPWLIAGALAAAAAVAGGVLVLRRRSR